MWNYAIYSAFLLFKFYQTDLNKIHDVHLLNFINNFLSKHVVLYFLSVRYGSKFTIRCSDLYNLLLFNFFSRKFDFFEVSVGFRIDSDR